jgi:hypothetical protein
LRSCTRDQQHSLVKLSEDVGVFLARDDAVILPIGSYLLGVPTNDLKHLNPHEVFLHRSPALSSMDFSEGSCGTQWLPQTSTSSLYQQNAMPGSQGLDFPVWGAIVVQQNRLRATIRRRFITPPIACSNYIREPGLTRTAPVLEPRRKFPVIDPVVRDGCRHIWQVGRR